MAWRQPVTKSVRPAGSPPDYSRATFRVTSPFGWRPDPLTPGGPPVFHGGLDLGDFGLGSPVVAAHDGRVAAVGYLGPPWSTPSGRWPPATNYGGWMVALDHGDGVTSVYAHLVPGSTPAAARVPGARVLAGQQVGNVGESGSAQGQGHLHFGIRVDGRDVDPWPIVTGATDPLDDLPMITAGLKPIPNRKTTIRGRIRSDASLTAEILHDATPPADPVSRQVIASVTGAAYPAGSTNRTWYWIILSPTATRRAIGVVHSGVCDPLTRIESVDRAPAILEDLAALITKYR